MSLEEVDRVSRMISDNVEKDANVIFRALVLRKQQQPLLILLLLYKCILHKYIIVVFIRIVIMVTIARHDLRWIIVVYIL